MNRTEGALLLLLRAGLWGKKPEDVSLFPLSADEWEKVYGEARRQTVSGWVYRGIGFLSEDLLPPQRVMFRWIVDVDRIEQRNETMNRCLVELTGLLEEKGIRAVVQKGQGVAALYEEPLLRECGDIDLYFPKEEDRRRAESWLHEQGKTLERKADGSTAYTWRQIEVEHHPALFDLSRPKMQDYLTELIAEKGFDSITLGNGGRIWVPAAELNLLLLNVHILKHAMGRGIGLRQFCDMARAYQVLGMQVDGEEMKRMYEHTGIGAWSRLLHVFLIKILGMPTACLPYREEVAESVEPLLDIVWRGGNFGKYEENRRKQESSVIYRKWETCRAFFRNAHFSMKYAPQEAIHTFRQLMTGQFK